MPTTGRWFLAGAKSSDVATPAVVTQNSQAPPDQERFSGVPEPDWHPKHGHLDLTETVERLSGPR